jgi:hypothetical protein
VGRYSIEKERYDDLTLEYFLELGYQGRILNDSFADVIAGNPLTNEIAIIEVKSIREKDAPVTWITPFNIRGKDRREVLEHMIASPYYTGNKGLMRLYAFTISSQLFTYYMQARRYIEKLHMREPLEGLDIHDAVIVPYLTVPVENRKPLKHVVSILIKNRLIKKATMKVANELVILQLTYFKRR